MMADDILAAPERPKCKVRYWRSLILRDVRCINPAKYAGIVCGTHKNELHRWCIFCGENIVPGEKSVNIKMNMLRKQYICRAHARCHEEAKQNHVIGQMKQHLVSENSLQPRTENEVDQFPYYTDIVCSYLEDPDIWKIHKTLTLEDDNFWQQESERKCKEADISWEYSVDQGLRASSD